MFDWLGAFTFRRRWYIHGAALTLVAVALLWGVGVFNKLTDDGFDDPASASSRAIAVANAQGIPRDDVDVVVLFTSDRLRVDAAAYRDAVESKIAGLPRTRVTKATTYWSAHAPGMISKDRKSTFAILQLAGASDAQRSESFVAIKPDLERPAAGLHVQLGGNVAVGEDIGAQVESDIQRAELISTPVLLVLLVIVFGGLVAASLPLAIGALAVLGSMTVLRVISALTDVSVFAVNIVTMLGLGLAIDYALFVVTRFREQLRTTDDVQAALQATMRTAGRTVAFSGLTVAISLGSLLLFPQVFLRSMAYGGICAVLIAMLGALTVLPAVLASVGPRIDSLQIRPPRRRMGLHRAVPPGPYLRIARAVMRRPIVFVVLVASVLIVLGTPFLRVQFGTVDYRALPVSTESRVVAERLASDFQATAPDPVQVVAQYDGAADSAAHVQSLTDYRARLAAVPGVVSAQVTGVAGEAARIDLDIRFATQSGAAKQLVAEVRAVPPPPGATVLVGGETAKLVDLLASLRATLPWMVLFMICTTLALLFAAFGSFVLPVKAVLMNVLSMGASFGAMVWIFQDGHLAKWLHFTVTGTVDSSQPILMLAIAFGLSMDYEVFLLSRIREQWDRTGDNTNAVATGLQRTGGVITSAALLLSVVFAAFATSGITFIKMIGVGMVIAIVVDATIVRTLLVPASMRLLGRLNWWAPPAAERWWRRYGIRENDESWSDADVQSPGVSPVRNALDREAQPVPSGGRIS